MPYEQRILDLKYNSVRFGQKSESEISLLATELLIIISVSTGWVLPDDDKHLKILEKQFEKKLIESYADLNKDEFEYALRNYEIKDWGKLVNLNLIDEVISEYKSVRLALSSIEERMKKPIKLENVNIETSDKEMAEWLMEWKYKVKEITNPTIIPPLFYDWLVGKKLLILTKEQKLDYLMNQAVAVRISNLIALSKTENEYGESRKQLTEFNLMRYKGVFEGIEVERLKEIAKKIAVFDYLKNEQ